MITSFKIAEQTKTIENSSCHINTMETVRNVLTTTESKLIKLHRSVAYEVLFQNCKNKPKS